MHWQPCAIPPRGAGEEEGQITGACQPASEPHQVAEIKFRIFMTKIRKGMGKLMKFGETAKKKKWGKINQSEQRKNRGR